LVEVKFARRRPATRTRMVWGNGAQFREHLVIAILIDVVDGVAECAAGVEHLALDIDSAVGENVVDGRKIPGMLWCMWVRRCDPGSYSRWHCGMLTLSCELPVLK